MTMKTWNGSNADWYANSSGDWNPAGEPATTDYVIIPCGTVTLTSGDAGTFVDPKAVDICARRASGSRTWQLIGRACRSMGHWMAIQQPEQAPSLTWPKVLRTED
jgi:hypothetical protein